MLKKGEIMDNTEDTFGVQHASVHRFIGSLVEK